MKANPEFEQFNSAMDTTPKADPAKVKADGKRETDASCALPNRSL
jgi:hypothetical protein